MPIPTWLLEHAAAIYLWALIGGFAVVGAWETARPLRPSTAPLAPRWTANVALLCLCQAAVHLALPLPALGAALWAEAAGVGLWRVLGLDGWAAILATVLALDLARYGLHRALHGHALLWRLHRVHHSDVDFDCTIGLRFHPLEALASAAALAALAAALGAPPVAVLLSDATTIALGWFAHANLGLPPRLDAALRRVLVTPDMHRIHHSALRAESAANLGSVLSVWDRLFGTHRAEPQGGHLGMRIGLPDERDPARLTLGRLLAMPLRRR